MRRPPITLYYGPQVFDKLKKIIKGFSNLDFGWALKLRVFVCCDPVILFALLLGDAAC